MRWAAALALASAALVPPALAAGQVTRPAPSSPGGRPDGGFTPFRYRGFAGTDFQAAALEQPDCPLTLAVRGVTREPSGVLLSIRLSNRGDGRTDRQVIGAWVVAGDGTVRGYQRHETGRAIAAGASRSFDVTLRAATTAVMPGDIVVVAVQETAGARPWRRDAKALEQDARGVVLR